MIPVSGAPPEMTLLDGHPNHCSAIVASWSFMWTVATTLSSPSSAVGLG